MVHWSISSTAPDPDIIHAAVRVIRKGGIIAFPTSTLYGLGADANNPQAVERIFEIKGRQPHRPLLVLIGDKSYLAELVSEIPPQSRFTDGGILAGWHYDCV